MKNSIKTKIGLGLIVMGIASPVFSLIVPFLNLSAALSASLVALFLVGLPEVFLIAGAALAGKEGLQLVMGKVKRALGLPEKTGPAPRWQYNLSLGLIVLWLIGIILPYYVPAILEISFIADHLLYISIGGEVLLILALILIGGKQLRTKLKNLFSYTPNYDQEIRADQAP